MDSSDKRDGATQILTPMPEIFQVKVLSLTGQKFRINVCTRDPVLAILDTLGKFLGVSTERLQLVLVKNSYIPLNNLERLVISYGIREGDTLRLQPARIKSGPLNYRSKNCAMDIAHDSPNRSSSAAASEAPSLEITVSQERIQENAQLKERMSELRCRIQKKKERRVSVGL